METLFVENTQGSNLKCLFLNTYYEAFVKRHYKDNPQLLSESYQIQKDSIQGRFFGDSDFYSEGLKKVGWDAEDLIINCQPLQETWARENNFHGYSDILEIAVEQIKRAKPDVIYLQDLNVGTRDFLAAIRQYTKLIVGQIASQVPQQADLQGFDIIISSFPHFVERFRQIGITSYYQPLAFEPRVLEKLPQSSREYPVTFVGGISIAHSERKNFLEALSADIPIDFWGYGIESLSESSSLKNFHGEAWGLEMFSVLRKSFITINHHIDVAENNANNMRLFEATGCGALLITDYKDNLNELFEIGKEVVAYRSPEECAALIKYYLSNPKEAEKIARAGQARTLRDHTYSQRMEKTAEILERHLRHRREKDFYPAPDMTKISYGHTPIELSEITGEMTSAWKSKSIPERQRALVRQELDNMYKGKIPTVYHVLADSLHPYVFPSCSILEIGCASGYYYEVLEYLLNMRISYTGVDYSEPLILMARDYYPKAQFHIADGASLPFENDQFFIVISGDVLPHDINYPQYISETARVAKTFVVAHRTPVCRRRPTQYLKKFAYGIEVVELRFNEKEILSEFTSNGLSLIKAFEYYSNPKEDEFEVTYVFEKTLGKQEKLGKDKILESFEKVELKMDFKDYHKLNLNDPILTYLLQNPHDVGLSEKDLAGKRAEQRADIIIGEYFAKLSSYCGKIASELLFRSQWGYVTPDWFDHRHHLLDPEKHFNDYWTASADNVLRVLPLHGKLLDMCSGDGFYDYYFYSKRAGEITCVDKNHEAYNHALRLHKADNITYFLEDILTFIPKESYYDVVVIRGAIEHFSRVNQQLIFRKAMNALKVGGWFCGDTVGNPKSDQKLLFAHENEWKDEMEMRRELVEVFDYVETYTMESIDRTTLFWRCKKIK